MSTLLDFNDKQALDAALSGGKGANLARLSQAGLAVPPGFVVTAQAYLRFAAQARAVLARAAGFPFADAARLETACKGLVRELDKLPVPDEVLRALRERLDCLPASTAFSVRSSATTEDLGGAAFAGQHDTYLNCKGFDDIARHLKLCWLSLWSARAVAYRRNAGFDVRDTTMAVVIQKMAFCDVAGVGFSIDPVSGNLGHRVFDANYGLGESVVGGEAAIDHFVLDKASGALVASQIAEKDLKIVAADSGTREVRLEGAARSAPCLSEPMLSELGALIGSVEKLYGYPQDIEWGFEAGKLWLLQSRPVTRIPARWTRDESAERFPSVITPLAWELVEEGFHRSLNYSFALMGLPPFKGKWFAMFDHYIYGNQNAVEIYANGAASSISIGSVAELVAAIPTLRNQYEWVLELPLTWSRDLDHYLMSLGELMAAPLEDRPVAELWAYVLRVKELGASYFLPNIAISITQRTLYRILLGIVQAALGSEQAAVAFDRLLAYCETKTGVINKELYRLARRVAALPALAARLRESSSRGFLEAGGFAAHRDIDAAFRKFLRDHGHREVEFDPYHPTWVEAPWLVVENLKLMLDTRLEDPADKERELKVAMRETEAALQARLPQELRFFVHEIVRLARAYTTLDDVEHYQTTRLTLPFRKGLHALGARLRALGVVDEPMDVFFAHCESMNDAVAADSPQRWKALGEEIRQEKQAYLRHRGETPKWQIGGADEATPAASGGGLSGLPGSPGSASGPVYKVHGSEDFSDFPKGAVLVARTTNPAWTPLFYRAVAVITESGGPLSHGAVTAREIGLPAVMSVRGALSALDNGQRVKVDGSGGRVTPEER
ncbi:MAG TPA: PEP/pyruvate-binding domain-containing protein [Burkholderiales bacterium]|nr:PEP/pyruvate-binding domain-containing protein [Burkholderiales bacterium]